MQHSHVHDICTVVKGTCCVSEWEVRCYLSIADVAQGAAAESSKGSLLNLYQQKAVWYSL